MKIKIFSMITAALLLTGFPMHKARASDAQVFGTLIGTATGGFIGLNIGSGDGRLAATAAGTLLGSIIGRKMGTAAYHHDRCKAVYGPVYKRTVYDHLRRCARPF